MARAPRIASSSCVDGSTAVERQPVQFIDSHPLNVVEHRLNMLQDAVVAVKWDNR